MIFWIQLLRFEQLSITVQVLVMVKLSDSYHWSSHLSWRYSSKTSVQLSVAVRVPRVNESIGVTQLIVVSFGQNVITGLVVSRTVISWIQVLIRTAIDRPGPRDGKWVGQLPLVFPIRLEDIRKSTSVLFVAVRVPRVNESIGVLQLIVVSFGRR